MFNLQFDPITTEMVIGKKKKIAVPSTGGSSATLSALVVPAPLELLINNLRIIEHIEITDTGAFSIYVDSVVEVT